MAFARMQVAPLYLSHQRTKTPVTMKTYITELERNGSRVCFGTEPHMNVQAGSMVAAARAASEHDAAMYADTVVVLIHHGSTGDTERIPFRILAKGRVSIN